MLEVEGVLVIGSEVPNLLETGAASTLVVSLLVVLGMLLVARDADLVELVDLHRTLPADMKDAVVSNLTVLSLMAGVPQMPDPARHREIVARLLERLGS